MLTTDVVQRFAGKLEITLSDCWLYTGKLTSRGYARVNVLGKLYYLHRLLYECLVDTISEDCELDHLCRHKACCNPDHLEPVSHQINVARGITGLINGLRQTLKTHCPRGHLYTESNTYRSPKRGERQCRLCRKEASQKCEKSRPKRDWSKYNKRG